MPKLFISLLPLWVLFACAGSSQSATSPDSTAMQKSTTPPFHKKTIRFFTPDEIPVTADLYTRDGNTEMIVLCHQAGFSRGEYIETAPKLVSQGFDCLAIDQRSGRGVNGIENETHRAARSRGLPTDYLAARQDIEAAIDQAYEHNHHHPIILVGSSYSASLALLIAAENDKVKAVAAFSPGEYLKSVKVGPALHDLRKPAFVTCAKEEIPRVEDLMHNMEPDYLTFLRPKTASIHGSRALWASTPGHEETWIAFNLWLRKKATR